MALPRRVRRPASASQFIVWVGRLPRKIQSSVTAVIHQKSKDACTRKRTSSISASATRLSNLTWFEGLLIARVHPVISVVTLTATGLLCYAGHVCNYFQKSFGWFQDLPAHIGNRKWFNIKRRKSINATASDTTQKKPTSANQARLSAAFKACLQYLRNVYAESRVNYMR